MKEICIINGDSYKEPIEQVFRSEKWLVSYWDVIPACGVYDIVIMFLDGIDDDDDEKKIRMIRREFVDYVDRDIPNDGWLMIGTKMYSTINTRHRSYTSIKAIFDSCSFGYRFKKRFYVWSSMRMNSSLCSKGCNSTKSCFSHDPSNWHLSTDNVSKQYIEMLKRYDECTKIPTGLLEHLRDILTGKRIEPSMTHRRETLLQTKNITEWIV